MHQRVYLVAIGRDLSPPVSFGNILLQRMRVALAPPGFPLERAAEAALVASRSAAYPARPVRGEILRDEHGRLYEKLGHFVRELGTIEASAEGELVEVERAAPSPPPQPAAQPVRQEPSSRKLFPDPGQWRVLRWSEFKAALTGQVAHPERLRDDHRLPCYVQVVEAGCDQPAGEFARLLFGSPQAARDLILLSPAAAERLELTELLPPGRETREISREHGMVRAGDRFFVLRVAADPTAAPVQPPPGKKRGIPERFTAGSFRFTREQVLASMREYPGVGKRFAQWVRSLFSRRAFDRWQHSLTGRPTDEQLWGWPPPAALLDDVRVSAWAFSTLEAAGYDPGPMLREWQIYWRRRGV